MKCPMCDKPFEQNALRELFEAAEKSPGLFLEFPIKGGGRLTILNPAKANQEARDALVRFIEGDEMADTMMRNRAEFQKFLDEYK